VLLWAQTVPIPSPSPDTYKAWPAPDTGLSLAVSSSELLADIKPKVIGRCPVHGDLHQGEIVVFYSADMKQRWQFCLKCLIELLEKSLPKVEEVEQ
jgi:phage pi2 protein 07